MRVLSLKEKWQFSKSPWTKTIKYSYTSGEQNLPFSICSNLSLWYFSLPLMRSIISKCHKSFIIIQLKSEEKFPRWVPKVRPLHLYLNTRISQETQPVTSVKEVIPPSILPTSPSPCSLPCDWINISGVLSWAGLGKSKNMSFSVDQCSDDSFEKWWQKAMGKESTGWCWYVTFSMVQQAMSSYRSQIYW